MGSHLASCHIPPAHRLSESRRALSLLSLERRPSRAFSVPSSHAEPQQLLRCPEVRRQCLVRLAAIRAKRERKWKNAWYLSPVLMINDPLYQSSRASSSSAMTLRNTLVCLCTRTRQFASHRTNVFSPQYPNPFEDPSNCSAIPISYTLVSCAPRILHPDRYTHIDIDATHSRFHG